MPVYYGVSGKARKISSGYYGVNGKSELVIDKSLIPSDDYLAYNYIYKSGSTTNNFNYSIKVNQWTEILCTFIIGNSGYKGTEDIYHLNTINYANIYFNNDSPILRISKGNSSINKNLTFNKEYTLIIGKSTDGDCYLNGTKLFADTSTFSVASINILSNYGNGSNGYKNLFIKGFKVYDLMNKEDLLNLIPCISKTSNDPGMYNTIEKTFKTSSYLFQVSNTVI